MLTLLQNNKDHQISELIFDLIKEQIILNAISTVINLKIPDCLKDGPKTVEQLAKKTNTHPNSLSRLLRMLSSIGIFTKVKETQEEDGHERIKFGLTPTASLLQSNENNMLKNFSLLLGRQSFKRSIDDLQYVIQTGENSFKHVNNLNIFEYLQQNAVDAKIFNEAMTAMTSSQISSISSLYDFSQFNTVVDIGGGQGLFLSSILKDNSNLTGIVFDLPYAIESVRKQQIQHMDSSSNVDNNGILSRCKFISGDFFKSIPSGADGYIIKNVLLNWDDESASTILKNCLNAMNFSMKYNHKIKPKLIIIDMIMPENNEISFGNLLDIMMMILTQNGRIRTKKEFTILLESCGFEITNILDSSSTSDPMSFLSIIEAMPKPISD
jgi:DNA-binding HxlR family transcriptional regulator